VILLTRLEQRHRRAFDARSARKTTDSLTVIVDPADYAKCSTDFGERNAT